MDEEVEEKKYLLIARLYAEHFCTKQMDKSKVCLGEWNYTRASKGGHNEASKEDRNETSALISFPLHISQSHFLHLYHCGGFFFIHRTSLPWWT